MTLSPCSTILQNQPKDSRDRYQVIDFPEWGAGHEDWKSAVSALAGNPPEILGILAANARRRLVSSVAVLGPSVQMAKFLRTGALRLSRYSAAAARPAAAVSMFQYSRPSGVG